MVGALRHGIFAGAPSTSSMASCYGAPGSSSCSAGGAKGKDSLVKTSFFFFRKTHGFLVVCWERETGEDFFYFGWMETQGEHKKKIESVS